MNINQIKDLEKRYQLLMADFEAGKMDQTAFIAEVDRLQFQDDWGRYWMIGTQTGSWHYYDGQNWHQADPREADNLPFMDEQGRYWQRGVKSGDWYYYQSETGEWVKPGEGDERAPASVQRQNQGYGTPYTSQLQPQMADAGPGMPSQLDGELFQDDEGRYWAIGAKTGQWYFYDQEGWHPAHEFQQRVAQIYGSQGYQPQYQPPYQQSTQGYQSQSQPGMGQPQPSQQGYVGQASPYNFQHPSSPTQPIQIYITSPGQETKPGGQPVQGDEGTFASPASYRQPGPTPQQPPGQGYGTIADQGMPSIPSQPSPQPQTGAPTGGEAKVYDESVESRPGAGPAVKPPKDRSDSGSWYYFDGEQWLRYSTGEPDEAPPVPPKMVIDQKSKSSQPGQEPQKEEPVVAEFIEDEEPPVEVVDVEVITVIEPEPETRPAPAPTSDPGADPREPVSRTPGEDIRPRRASRPVKRTAEIPPRTRSEPVRQPRERTSSEPRPVLPRKKETAHEPTIIIPTGAAASSISPQSRGGTRTARPSPGERRRAREDTLPIEAVKGERAPAANSTDAHRGVTQAMPTTAPAAPRADTAQMRAAQVSKQRVQPRAQVAPQAEKSSYTLGDIFRSVPSTVWTAVGGVVLLLACALGLIFTWSWLQNGDLAPGGLAAIPSLTPTLDAGPPDATPTPGPTPSPAPELETTATPASTELFSSADLGFSVDYPDTWEQEEEDLCVSFSPSADGLDRENPQDAGMWICQSAEDDAAIADLLAEVLTSFPSDSETLNEGTISIASQTWTSAQIRYEDEDLGGQGIATLAVTNKDGSGYQLVALAPAEEWNSTQPLFQAMINSFSFSTRTIAEADEPDAEQAAATPGGASTRQTTAPEEESAPEESPTPKGTATPLVYVVQSGDTLLDIALKFGIDTDLLASKNDIDDPGSLQLGQELVIPFTAEELEAYNAGQPVVDAAPASGAEEDEVPVAEAEVETESAGAEPAAADSAPAAEEPPAAEAAPLSGKIAYPAYNPGTNVYDLWMADVSSGEQTMIAAEASQPIFNRDGSLLAYRSWGLGTRGIFFRDFVGGRGGQVTRFVEDALPTWAPDGFSFAFSSRREGDRVPRVFIGNQQGDDAYGIGFQGEYPATFPDGRLAVKGCTPQGDCGLFVMGATGGGETKISSEYADTAPAVSPDGSKIAFMSSDRGATNWEIWVMNPDGSNPQRLTENGSNEGLPTWSPDGQSIAYVSDQGGVWAIWAMNADGSNQRKLFNMMGTPDGTVLHDADNSKGWLEERISWAP